MKVWKSWTQLLELGRKFEKLGLYLANFFPLDDKSEEENLAQFLAQQFYSYGCSLQQKTKNSDTLPRNILLSEEEMSEVDQRLLGKQAYEKRLARLWENPSTDQLNAMRKELLTTAFKALKRDSFKEEWEKSRETKKCPYYKFQEKVQSQILRVIQTPETELYTTIFRRGRENLISNMLAPKGDNHMRNFLRKNLGVDLPFLKTKLTDALKLSILKSELEKVRKTGNKNLISDFYFLFKSVSLKNSWTNASASLGEESLSFPHVMRWEPSNVVFIFFKSPMVALICWTISQQ